VWANDMSNEYQQRTAVDELFRNFVAAASVLAIVAAVAFFVMSFR
jgi:hypothetical protein